MFIVDPFPPLSRIIALICVAVVHWLTLLERRYRMHEDGQVQTNDAGIDQAESKQVLLQNEKCQEKEH